MARPRTSFRPNRVLHSGPLGLANIFGPVGVLHSGPLVWPDLCCPLLITTIQRLPSLMIFGPRGVHHSGPDTHASLAGASVIFHRQFGPTPYIIPARCRTSFRPGPVHHSHTPVLRSGPAVHHSGLGVDRSGPSRTSGNKTQSNRLRGFMNPNRKPFSLKPPINSSNQQNACGKIFIFLKRSGQGLS